MLLQRIDRHLIWRSSAVFLIADALENEVLGNGASFPI